MSTSSTSDHVLPQPINQITKPNSYRPFCRFFFSKEICAELCRFVRSVGDQNPMLKGFFSLFVLARSVSFDLSSGKPTCRFPTWKSAQSCLIWIGLDWTPFSILSFVVFLQLDTKKEEAERKKNLFQLHPKMASKAKQKVMTQPIVSKWDCSVCNALV